MEKDKKCTNKKHGEIDAINYCIECNVYFCKKCSNYHSEIFENHHAVNLDKNIKELFTGLCLEPDHGNKLLFYCKSHNKLCCAACLSKIKEKGNGQHFDCTVCSIEEIKDEKKKNLNENIKLLEDFSKTIDKSINELKKIFNEINEEKVELKLNISKIFTKIRNTINEREDEILSEIDKIYEKSFFKEDIIKIGEKLPNQIKIALEKGNTLCKEWDDNKNKLNSKINDCIYIENNIKNISEIKNNIDKCNSKKINIKFIPSDESINKYLKEIKEFGDLYDLEKVTLEFKFKPGSNYEVTNDGYVATKNKGDNSFNCTIIGDKEIPKHKLSKWKIKLNNIMEENMDILIGIGPDNPNNEINFYLKCWTFSTFNSNLVLKSEDYIDYNNQSKKLKKGDIVEVLVDRKKGNLYFSVNDLNYGIASSEIPKDETLYPIIMIHDQKMSVEII